MKTLTLTQSWQLTTEHSASRNDQPVLVKRHSSEFYGPNDIVETYPSHGLGPAHQAVERLAKVRARTPKEQEFIEKFKPDTQAATTGG